MDGSDNMENTNNISREEVDCFGEVEAFNYQLMDMYVKQKDYDSAKMIAEKYPNNEMIQYKLITICIESKRFEEGIEIAKKYPDSRIIQNQLIALYIKTEKYDDVIEIYNIQLMSIYCMKEDYDEALKIAEKYPDNDLIQSLLIHYVLKLEDMKME